MDKKEFKSKLKSKDFFIIKISATWCQPCKVLQKVIDDLYKGEDFVDINGIEVSCYNADVESELGEYLATENKIRNVPTLLYYGLGELKLTTSGLQSEENIIKNLKEIII